MTSPPRSHDDSPTQPESKRFKQADAAQGHRPVDWHSSDAQRPLAPFTPVYEERARREELARCGSEPAAEAVAVRGGGEDVNYAANDESDEFEMSNTSSSVDRWAELDNNREVRERRAPKSIEFQPQFVKVRDYGVVRRFKAWCKRRGIEIDPRIEIVHRRAAPEQDGDDVMEMVAIDTLAPGEIIVKVPKHAVLSVRTSTLAPSFPAPQSKHMDRSKQAMMDLALCLLYEQMLGEGSAFKPFIDTFPPNGVQLPMFRDSGKPRQAWRWINGTEADRLACRAKAKFYKKGSLWPYDEQDYGISKEHIRCYIEEIALPMVKKARAPDKLTYFESWGLVRKFETAFSIVSSRCFIVDVHHGPALVPVCDLFDHDDMHTVHFESNDAVCADCSVLSTVSHPHAAPIDSDGAPGPIATDTVDMRTLAPHFYQDVLYNSYGPLSNAQLLTRYGFCLEMETAMERITWDLRFNHERREVGEAFFVGDNWSYGLDFGLGLCADMDGSKGDCNNEDEDSSDDDEEGYEAQQIKALPKLDLFGSTSDSNDDEDEDDNPLLRYFAPLTGTTLLDTPQRVQTELEQELAKTDAKQPLFVDGEGRISRVLLRFALLVAIPLSKFVSDKDQVMGCESTLRSLLEGYTYDNWQEVYDVKELEIVEKALDSLSRLVGNRKRRMHVAKYEEKALIMLQYAPSSCVTLRSCLLHATQEHAALRAAEAAIDELRTMVNKMLTTQCRRLANAKKRR
ncbi:hypothetical protein ACQY0O_000444 [Thecaphora frezii]